MREIELTQGFVALIDDEDLLRVNSFKMHRFLLNTPVDLTVDHIDGDTLNNQRHNIRNCTLSENLMNKKKYGPGKFKGVTFHPNGKWRARIQFEYEQYFLGYFNTEDEAAKAYNNMALILCGEYAVLNDVNEIFNEEN